MLVDFIKQHFQSQAEFIQTNGYGFGQVEPNHLSAQRTAQIYAQLPADAKINMLEQGQFVKYDYANGLVNFTGPGEWMLVYNEIKLYRDHQLDCEFAMIKDNYQARVYSPLASDTSWDKQARYLNGKNSAGQTSETVNTLLYASKYDKTTKEGIITVNYEDLPITGGKFTYNNTEYTVADDGSVRVNIVYTYDDFTAAVDPYELHYNEDPFHIESGYHEKLMPAGTTMVPRVFKTNVGDIFTTNTIGSNSVSVGDILVPRAADGILTVKASPAATDMQWQAVKVYTMPDHQPGVKVMRIA